MTTQTGRYVWAGALCLGVGAAAVAAVSGGKGPSVKTLPPVVIGTSPMAGETQVDAAKTTEIRVTFSKTMLDGSWSWGQLSEETFPEITGKLRYDQKTRTCIAPVKLVPGRTYAIWLNSEKFHHFKDADGRAAVPYLLAFETSPGK